METIYQELITELKKNPSDKQWAKLKRDLSQKHKIKSIPTNIQVLLNVNEEDLDKIKNKLITKPVRTISGVSPVALMTKPDRCPHGKCTFCVGGIGSPWGDIPQSYTGHEPATMRGIRNNYDAYLQLFNRLEQYVILGHKFDKIEIIVMGGTFTATKKEYQEEFIYGTFKAMNDFSDLFFKDKEFNFLQFKEFFELPTENIYDKDRIKRIQDKLLKMKNKTQTTIEHEQLKNETSNIRCVALCIETKPDWGFLKHGNEMLRQGCTRVELGIQSVYDDVLKEVHRGHTVDDSKRSIQILRDLGFKINFHYMPGLPLTDRERDLEGMKQLFTDESYKPDMIKMYPCMVGPGTPLYYQWKAGKFNPITSDEASSLIIEWKKFVPEYCRIQRVQRDVPTKYWEAGVDKTNLRQLIFDKGVVCRCIRCREPKGKQIYWDKVEIKVNKFLASGGKEFFISIEADDILLGFCRLRFPKEFLRKEITETSALIRELHVYGTATAIGDSGEVQHKGFGKQLMQKAEEIALQNGKDKIVVISGVGVKEYYKKLGYVKEGVYVVKELYNRNI
jgi:elongator complex protein 3